MRPLPSPLETLLDRLADSDAVRPIDVALARLLVAHDLAPESTGETDRQAVLRASGAEGAADRHASAEHLARARAVALAAALVSACRSEGHSLVALGEWAGRTFPGTADAALPRFPDLAAWRAALAASPVAGPPEAGLPLVAGPDDTLALARLHHAETRVAAAIRARVAPEAEPAAPAPTAAAPAATELAATELAAMPEGPVPDALAARFGALFPPRPTGAPPDWQAVAAVAALTGRLTLVAGGPGTGKTHTATRLLALLLERLPALRVALAAPTGKAARRLAESLAQGRAGLPPDLAARLPAGAVTLHRLLGYAPDRGFRFDARHPLPLDLVLVDEGSMIDLPLFDALLAALPEGARLVVMGDPDQLPSVEAGAVFGALCEAGGEAPGARLRRACRAAGIVLPPAPAPSPAAAPLADAVVTLRESRRFGEDSDVGALARAYRDGNAAAVRALLQNAAREHVSLADARDVLGWMLPHARAVLAARTPEKALALLGAQGLLAALRRGPRGVEGLGAALEKALRAEGRIPPAPWRGGEPFYPGRPLLVTANDDALGLANGDIGVCWREDGARVVCFPPEKPGEPARRVPHARLRASEGAWALTVHKSQGSEYDRVGVVLPAPQDPGADLVSRELLYTAVTRARQAVALFGDLDFVADAAARPTLRRSGLAQRLRTAPDAFT